jgi:hypothetical protein
MTFYRLFYTKVKGSTRLVYTGLLGGLEHLKIETRISISEDVLCVDDLCTFKERDPLFGTNRPWV